MNVVKRATIRLMRWSLALLILLSIALAQADLEQMQSLIAEGRYASAAQIVGPNLVRDYPDNAEAHYLYGYALYVTGNITAARSEINQALALSASPVDPRYDHLSALLFAAENDFDSAKRLLRNAFIRSQSYDIAMDWARISWQVSQFGEALEIYLSAAATPRGRSELWPHLNRGRILKDLGRYEEAITAFETAITVFEDNDPGTSLPSPGYIEAFYRMGEVYELMGDMGRARANYEAAQIDPNYTPAAEALKRLLFRVP